MNPPTDLEKGLIHFNTWTFFEWLTIVVIGFVAWRFLAWAILECIVIVPAGTFGVRERGGKTVGKPLLPGRYFRFLSEIRIISLGIEHCPITGMFMTKEGSARNDGSLKMTFSGAVEFKVDPLVRTKKINPSLSPGTASENETAEPAFVKMAANENVITERITSTAKSILTTIGGMVSGMEVKNRAHDVENLINSLLRLSKAPHERHENCGTPSCPYPVHVLPHELLDFYRDHATWIKSLLDDEKNHEADRSTIETEMGVDIIEFKLEGIEFSEETVRAMESKKQAEERAGAIDVKIKASKKLRKAGFEDEQIIADLVDNATETVPRRQVISIEGQGGNVVVAQLAAQRVAASQSQKKDKKGGK